MVYTGGGLSLNTVFWQTCARFTPPLANDMQMEDPSSLLSRLTGELKAMAYESYTTAYDPAPGGSGPLNALKLRSGQGESVVRVLAFLCDTALQARGWKWSKPRFTEGDGYVQAMLVRARNFIAKSTSNAMTLVRFCSYTLLLRWHPHLG